MALHPFHLERVEHARGKTRHADGSDAHGLVRSRAAHVGHGQSAEGHRVEHVGGPLQEVACLLHAEVPPLLRQSIQRVHALAGEGIGLDAHMLHQHGLGRRGFPIGIFDLVGARHHLAVDLLVALLVALLARCRRQAGHGCEDGGSVDTRRHDARQRALHPSGLLRRTVLVRPLLVRRLGRRGRGGKADGVHDEAVHLACGDLLGRDALIGHVHGLGTGGAGRHARAHGGDGDLGHRGRRELPQGEAQRAIGGGGGLALRRQHRGHRAAIPVHHDLGDEVGHRPAAHVGRLEGEADPIEVQHVGFHIAVARRRGAGGSKLVHREAHSPILRGDRDPGQGERLGLRIHGRRAELRCSAPRAKLSEGLLHLRNGRALGKIAHPEIARDRDKHCRQKADCQLLTHELEPHWSARRARFPPVGAP